MDNFRKGVAALILNKNNEVVVFQRADYPISWHGPEGGMEPNETPIEALYREVYEEIGLKKEDYSVLKESKNFIRYTFPQGIKKDIANLGQEKKFFLLKLNKDCTFKFNVLIEEIEFINSKSVDPKLVPDLVPDFKRDMYITVLKEFGLI